MAYKIKTKKLKEKKIASSNPYFVDGKDMSKVPIYYLEGEYGLTPKQELALWQYGVDTGQVWKLQGWYGRNAQDMLNAGVLEYPKKKTYDYYGNPIPVETELRKKYGKREVSVAEKQEKYLAGERD